MALDFIRQRYFLKVIILRSFPFFDYSLPLLDISPHPPPPPSPAVGLPFSHYFMDINKLRSGSGICAPKTQPKPNSFPTSLPSPATSITGMIFTFFFLILHPVVLFIDRKKENGPGASNKEVLPSRPSLGQID